MEVPNTQTNFEKCICKDCPSYSSCMSELKEALFCSIGKSKCEIKKEDCICITCPIDKGYNLTGNLDLMERMILKMNQFYCENSPAK